MTILTPAAFLAGLSMAAAFAPPSRGARRQLPSLAAALGESIEFAKYEGLGNDFILIDDRDKAAPSLTPDQSERLCDRNFCVGGDGVIFALKAPEGEALVVAWLVNVSGGPARSQICLFCD